MRLYSGRNHLSGFQWINNNFYMTDTSTWYGLKASASGKLGGDIEPDVTYLKPEETVFMHTLTSLTTSAYSALFRWLICRRPPKRNRQHAVGTSSETWQCLLSPCNRRRALLCSGPDQKEEITELLRRMYQGSANAGPRTHPAHSLETVKFQNEFDNWIVEVVREFAVMLWCASCACTLNG